MNLNSGTDLPSVTVHLAVPSCVPEDHESQLMISETDESEREAIISTLASISFAEREEVVQDTLPFITEGMDGWQKCALIETIAAISLGERKDVVQKALPFITAQMDRWHRKAIIEALAAIPGAEREKIAQYAHSFIGPGMDGWHRKAIIEALAAIPGAEREKVAQYAHSFMRPEMDGLNRKAMIESLAAIPMNERPAIVQYAHLFELSVPGHPGDDFIETLAAIPRDERRDMVNYALALMNEEEYLKHKKSFIKVLTAIPSDEREDIVRCTVSLAKIGTRPREKQLFIKQFAKISKDERHDVINYAYGMVDPKNRGRLWHLTTLLDLIALIPRDERLDVLKSAASFMRLEMTIFNKKQIISSLIAVPPAERLEVAKFTAKFLNDELGNWEIPKIMQSITDVPAGFREEIIQQTLALNPAGKDVANTIEGLYRRHEERARARQMAREMDVHTNDRDLRTRRAIESLYSHQGAINAAQINQANHEFVAFLNGSSRSLQDKERVQLALEGTPRRDELNEEFGALIDEGTFGLTGFTVSGKELMGRLWIFASQLSKKEEENAKEGAISALLNSYNFDNTRICNQGKAQRLAIAILQGRLAGADIEEIRGEGQRPTPQLASQEFFTIKAHQEIEELPLLLAAANRFCDDRPLVYREAFMREINEYAEQQGIE